MPDLLLILSSAAEGSEPAGPTLFGLDPTFYVSLAMSVLILIMLWKKVPGLITGGLDKRIAAIRDQLDEAKTLRAEAEALRNEYATKIAGAEKDAEAMMETAQKEADSLLAKAEEDSKMMITRRKKMAEDKISAAERDAIDYVRNRAASAATAAAGSLIAEKHDGAADSKLADELIAGI